MRMRRSAKLTHIRALTCTDALTPRPMLDKYHRPLTLSADFNMVEYLQKLRHYAPALREKGVERTLVTVNGSPESCLKLSTLLDLPEEIELFSDPSGAAGRAFGVSRGWLPDENLSPYLKLFGMLFGLGAGGTLPSVIAGYIGNPWGTADWIESALAQGQAAGRRQSVPAPYVEA
uniref:Uncharacterized protein n=1 Tax=Chrysotila carterae TaxID=13221 RepID=A0A7S4F4T7_CHRCT|eukprot:6093696-Pleurochrysis_carterae.AAC.2